MKNLGIVVLLVCVLGLAAMCWDLNAQVNEKELALIEQQAKVQETQNKVEELENKIEQVKNTLAEAETKEVEEIPAGKVDKKKFKVAAKGGFEYTKYAPEEKPQLGVVVEIDNGKAYVTVDSKNEMLQSFGGIVDLKNVKDVTDREITGFSAKPVEVFYGQFGHEVIDEVILFLMNDGTVEYINTADLLNNSDYKSQGKKENLSNVVKFDILSAWEEEGGGYVTTIAIDKDGYYYDLNEM